MRRIRERKQQVKKLRRHSEFPQPCYDFGDVDMDGNDGWMVGAILPDKES